LLQVLLTPPDPYFKRRGHWVFFFVFFFTLVTGPRRFLSLKLSDTRVRDLVAPIPRRNAVRRNIRGRNDLGEIRARNFQ